MIIDNQEDFIIYCKQDIYQVINIRVGKKYGAPTIFDVKKFIKVKKKDDLKHIIWDKEMV